MAIGIIAKLTFREAASRKILWAALSFGAAFLALYGVGVYFLKGEIAREAVPPVGQREIYNFLAMAGLYAVNFLVVMLAVLTSVDTLAGEIASGTMQTVATKPLRRFEIIMGKWLGFVAMIVLYVALMAGGVVVVTYAFTGYVVPGLAQGMGLIMMEGVTLLSVCFLGGTRLSTLANGVLAFGLYGLAFLGGWIEQVGSLLRSETAVNIGILSSLLIPSEALWKRAAHEMQSPLVRDIGSATPFASTSVPNERMVLYAVVYIAVMLMLALRQFSRRDL